jgi:hypothetical protein
MHVPLVLADIPGDAPNGLKSRWILVSELRIHVRCACCLLSTL